ncbi:ABC transporter permease [Spirochaeta dissipatitropha]
MELIFASIMRRWSQNPLRLVFSVSSLVIAVAILAMVFSITSQFSSSMGDAEATIYTVANGTIRGPHEYEPQGWPPRFNADTPEAVRDMVPDIQRVSRLSEWAPDRFVHEGIVYKVSSVQGVDPAYLEMANYELIAGRVFRDWPEGSTEEPELVISRELAEFLYASADAAVGQSIDVQLQHYEYSEEGGHVERFINLPVIVSGVYESRGTAMGQSGRGAPQALVAFSSLEQPEAIQHFIIQSDQPPSRLEAQLSSAVQSLHGQDTELSIWKGASSWYQGERGGMGQMFRQISLFLHGIALLIMLISGFGVLSTMLVSTLERMREMGLRRAVGSSYWGIVTLYATDVIAMVLISLLPAYILFQLFYPQFSQLVPLFFRGMPGAEELVSARRALNLIPFLSSAGIALGFALLFGIVPALFSARVSPVDSLREV